VVHAAVAGSCIVSIQRTLNSASSTTSGSGLPLSGMLVRSSDAYPGYCSARSSSEYVLIPEFTTYLL
jgi:hypothetical protein